MSTKPVKLHDRTNALVAALAPLIVAKDNAIVVDPKAYESTLPEGVTLDQVNAISAHNSSFYAAALKVGGMAAVDIMAASPDIKEVPFVVPTYHGSSFEVTVDRERTFPGLKVDGKESPPTTKYGHADVTMMISEATASRGDMKKVRSELSAYAKEKFASEMAAAIEKA